MKVWKEKDFSVNFNASDDVIDEGIINVKLENISLDKDSLDRLDVCIQGYGFEYIVHLYSKNSVWYHIVIDPIMDLERLNDMIADLSKIEVELHVEGEEQATERVKRLNQKLDDFISSLDDTLKPEETVDIPEKSPCKCHGDHGCGTGSGNDKGKSIESLIDDFVKHQREIEEKYRRIWCRGNRYRRRNETPNIKTWTWVADMRDDIPYIIRLF